MTPEREAEIREQEAATWFGIPSLPEMAPLYRDAVFGRRDLLAALDAERERSAKLERVLQVAQGLPAATAPAGSDGGWVWYEEWEAFADAVNEAVAALDETP